MNSISFVVSIESLRPSFLGIQSLLKNIYFVIQYVIDKPIIEKTKPKGTAGAKNVVKNIVFIIYE